ncbi:MULTISPECIES: transposase domain-containing protein [Methylobacter]
MLEIPYYGAKELAGLAGMPGTVQRVNDKAKRDNWLHRTRTGKGGGKEYPLSALPEETRTYLTLQAGRDEFAGLYKDQLPKASPEIQVLVDQAHAEMPDKPEFFIDWEHFRRKTAKVQGKAYQQAEVVVQLKKLIDTDKRRVFAIRQDQDDRRAENSPLRAKKTPLNTLMQQVSAANPAVCTSWRTLQNWWLGKPGKPGCINFDVADYAPALAGCYAGRTKMADCSPAAFEYYVQLYLHRRQPSFKDCHRRTEGMAKQMGWTLPGEATMRRRIEAEYSSSIITFMREGPEALRLLTPFQVRDKTVFRAGEAVSGDGLKFDKLWTVWPDGEIINTSTAWVWQDLYSGKIVAWRLGKTESTDLFRLATFDLTGQFLPSYLQVDNTRVAANKMMTGGAEGRHRFGNQPNDPLGMLLMLGMDVHFTDPDHTIASPGSKPVERAFGIGGLHSKVAENPKIRDRGFSKATAITSDELRDAIAYEVIRHNAQEKRRSPVCGGVMSFDQAYEKSFVSWAPRVATQAQRRLLMLAIEVVKANSNNGMVTIKAGKSQLGSNRYWCETLNEYRGQSVGVFYDPDDLTKDVDIYSLDGKYLMTAQYEPSVGFTDKDAGSVYLKRTKRINKLVKKQAVEVKAIQKLHNDKLPALSEPEAPESKVVTGLFNKPLDQGLEGESSQVIDADAVFSKAIAMMTG